MSDYRKGESGIEYPSIIEKNLDAQAFYGVAEDVFVKTNYMTGKGEIMAELSLEIDKIIDRYSKRDWHDNPDVHNKIAQEIDDLLYDFAKDHEFELSFDQIDEIIDQVKKVALRRY